MPEDHTDEIILYDSDTEVQALISQCPRLEANGAIALLSRRFLAEPY
jgi:hypothetical protein